MRLFTIGRTRRPSTDLTAREQKKGLRLALRVTGCLWLCGVALTATPAAGMSTIRPAYFALPPTAFPAPSSGIRSHVEPNWRVHRDNVLHFGTSFAKEGRITGYFMEALEGREASPTSDTSYLVSLFPTVQDASIAFAEQRYYWDALTAHGGSSAVALRDGSYADPDHQGLYVVQMPTGASLAELLFTQGTMVVEVFQEVYAARPSHAETRAFFDLGTRLAIIARGILATS